MSGDHTAIEAELNLQDARINSAQMDADNAQDRADTAHTELTAADLALRAYINQKIVDLRTELTGDIGTTQGDLTAAMIQEVTDQINLILPNLQGEVTAAVGDIDLDRVAIQALRDEIVAATDGVMNSTLPLLTTAQEQLDSLVPDIQQQLDTFTYNYPHASVQEGFDEFTVTVGELSATLTNNYYTAASTEAAIAGALTALQASMEDPTGSVGSVTADLENNYYTSAQADSAISAAVTSLQSSMEAPEGSVGSLTASLQNDYYTITGVDNAISAATTTLQANMEAPTGSIGSLSATLQSSYYTIAQTDAAIATAETNLQASIDGLSAQVTTTQTALATVEGNLAATLAFRVEAGSGGAGLELIAANDTNGAVSLARINADNILLDGTVTMDHLNAASMSAAGFSFFDGVLKSDNFDGTIDGSNNITDPGTQGIAFTNTGDLALTNLISRSTVQVGAVSDGVTYTLAGPEEHYNVSVTEQSLGAWGLEQFWQIAVRLRYRTNSVSSSYYNNKGGSGYNVIWGRIKPRVEMRFKTAGVWGSWTTEHTFPNTGNNFNWVEDDIVITKMGVYEDVEIRIYAAAAPDSYTAFSSAGNQTVNNIEDVTMIARALVR